MHLGDFIIQNLRCIGYSSVSLHKNINLIVGENGSGKTSFLEGIHLLASGKTFRPTRRHDLIKDGTVSMAVAGVFETAAKLDLKVRLEKSLSETKYFFRGNPVNKTSEISLKFPVLVGNSRAADLLTDSPKARRDLIDRAVFHVKPSFLNLWKDLRKALAQRNILLRSKRFNRQLSYWDQVVEARSQDIDACRRDVVNSLNCSLADSILREELGIVSVDYYSGWDLSLPLMEHLTSNRESESRIGYTLYGAHRADLHIKAAERRGAKRLSKGQLKVIAFEAIVALHEYISKNGSVQPILLADDISAELDIQKRKSLIDKILRLGGQKVLSSIHSDMSELVDRGGSKVFHVEQGTINYLKG